MLVNFAEANQLEKKHNHPVSQLTFSYLEELTIKIFFTNKTLKQDAKTDANTTKQIPI